MHKRSDLVALACAVLLAACGEQGSGMESSQTAATGSGATSVGDESVGSEVSGTVDDSETTGPEAPTPEICEEIQSETDCTAYPSTPGQEPKSCAWVELFEMSVADEMCSFGPSLGRCIYAPTTEGGCGSSDICAEGNPVGIFEVVDGAFYAGYGEPCFGSGGTQHGTCAADDVPEACQCLCDPDFPGEAPPH